MKKFVIYRKGSRFIKIYLGLTILSILIVFMFFTASRVSLETDIKEQTENDLATYSNIFLEEISQLSTDIFLITDLLKVHDSLIIDNGDTIFISEASRDIVETEFLVWLGMKKSYDQIRILDNNGMEIVRANFNSGNPTIAEVLQNKAGRYYFDESIILNNRDLYMSLLDLNKENGEIELIDGQPKPMLRVATPLFNDDGVQLGIIIINYLADEIFDALDSRGSVLGTHIEIVNEDGFYLYAIDESVEFGFMYGLDTETFSKYHNYDIFTTPSGEIHSEEFEDEFYTSIRLSSLELTNAANKSGNNDLNIVFGTKEFIIFTELDLSENPTYQDIIILSLTVLGMLAVSSLVITRLLDESIYLRKENIKRMTYDSLHDLLTTLPNRKSIYEQISNQLHRKNKFTLLFLDFDGFKLINDEFGHNVGDEALIQGSQRIKDSIRFDDILARIGGDEFIVLLRDLSDSKVVSRICETIVRSFDKLFDLNGHSASMGVSIGAYICKDKAEDIEDIDDIVSKSDKAMYHVKNSGKNSYSIFSED